MNFSKETRDMLKSTGTLAGTTVGSMPYPVMDTHLGCIPCNWDEPAKQFLRPCPDALFDPLKEGENSGGAMSRTPPYFPVKAVDGKLVVSSVPSGYVGVKRTT